MQLEILIGRQRRKQAMHSEQQLDLGRVTACCMALEVLQLGARLRGPGGRDEDEGWNAHCVLLQGRL